MLAALIGLVTLTSGTAAHADATGVGPSATLASKTSTGVVVYRSWYASSYTVENDWDVRVQLRSAERVDRLSTKQRRHQTAVEVQVAYNSVAAKCSTGQATSFETVVTTTRVITGVDGGTSRGRPSPANGPPRADATRRATGSSTIRCTSKGA